MKLVEKPKVDLEITFTLNEKEAIAIDALVGYDFDSFIKVFKEHLGKHYMDGHEEVLRGIFAEFRQRVPGYLARIKTARKVFEQ